ncbi:MAG: HIT family protein [Saprospiraceae bacterium]|jgi:histidine triad (HIT) family protein|nr:HIT family protein [Saprospiraceae bacterium]
MTIFSKIIAGEIPAYKIAENDRFLAFLDIRPLQKGHTLVIPKVETDYIFDIADAEFGELMLFAKRVASAIKTTVPCKKVGMAVIGLEVAHAHIHLVPINEVKDLSFGLNEPLKLSDEELTNISMEISKNFS